MQQIIKYLLFITVVVFTLIAFYYFQTHKQADFGIIGKFKYRLTDTTLSNKTYLSSESYGFLITDLPVEGLEIIGLDLSLYKDDFIISLGYPIDAVYLNSEAVRNQSENFDRKPIEIIKDAENKNSQYVYVYFLKPKGRYRLLLP